jgi:hypothetical protein
MNPRARLATYGAAMFLLGGCVVYEPMPVSPQQTVQQRFDRSWAAATDAMFDQGITIRDQDRGAGVIRGVRGESVVTATLLTLSDGSVQVTFNSTGPSGVDPGLAQRVHESYERRMGR